MNIKIRKIDVVIINLKQSINYCFFFFVPHNYIMIFFVEFLIDNWTCTSSSGSTTPVEEYVVVGI